MPLPLDWENGCILGCPVTAIEHSETGVMADYREFGKAKEIEGGYLVSCMSLV